jgi:hypothetical protein
MMLTKSDYHRTVALPSRLGAAARLLIPQEERLLEQNSEESITRL